MTQLVNTQVFATAVDPVYAAPADLHDEFEGTRDSLLQYNFKGNTGRFLERADDKEADPNTLPNQIGGVVLSKQNTQVFIPDKEWGFKSKWICRNSNTRGLPTVNPDLTPDEKERVSSYGYGRQCQGCPAAQWRKNAAGRNVTACKSGIRLGMLLDNNLPATVDFSGANSAILDQFLGANFKRSNKAWWANAVTFASSYRNKDGNAFHELVPKLGPQVQPELMGNLYAIRQQYLAQFEGAHAVEHESEESTSAPATPASEPSVSEDGNLDWSVDL